MVDVSCNIGREEHNSRCPQRRNWKQDSILRLCAVWILLPRSIPTSKLHLSLGIAEFIGCGIIHAIPHSRTEKRIRPRQGHVIGTRHVVVNMTDKILFLRAISGTHVGEYLALPRMNYETGMEDFPVLGFRRCQFPVWIFFAMTVNKAQGQSVPCPLGIDLSYPCFFHGELYVALSRMTNPNNLFVLTNQDGRKTKNMVLSEVISESYVAPKYRVQHVDSIRAVTESEFSSQRTMTESLLSDSHIRETRMSDAPRRSQQDYGLCSTTK